VDITERKRAEEALRESKEALERSVAELQAKNEEVRTTTQQLWQAAKLASVGELAASIAHELNNPLATVCLRAESVLRRTAADDPRRRALEVIDQEARRMGELVANLLQFSRRGVEQVSTVDVRQELAGAVDLIHHQLRKRQIAAVRELAPETPTIYGDRQKLRQVFLNLLTNASDAMPRGGTLTLRAAPAALEGGKPGVLVEVSDTGVGIPAEHLGKALEPFFTTKEEGKGTGLGLAICRRIVQEHHGTLQLLSEVGKGTTVRLLLPVKDGANVAPLRAGEGEPTPPAGHKKG
jgi:signal transduction histidine kinase